MRSTRHTIPGGKTLAEWVHDARQRTFTLVADLNDEQLLGPRLAIVNPLLWEIGHVAWFQEKWVLRRSGASAAMRHVDALYDNSAKNPRHPYYPDPPRRITFGEQTFKRVRKQRG